MGKKKQQRAKQRQAKREKPQQLQPQPQTQPPPPPQRRDPYPEYPGFAAIMHEATSLASLGFEAIMHEATSLASLDDDHHYAACEKCLEAVQAAPSVWTENRFFAFTLFLDFMDYVPSSDGKDLTERLNEHYIDNENEPPHFRVAALYWTMRCQSWHEHLNFNASAEVARHALDIIKDALLDNEIISRQDELVLFMPLMTSEYENHFATCKKEPTLKNVLDYLGSKIQTALDVFEFKALDPEVIANLAAWRKCLVERWKPGGHTCDCCGKTKEDLQLDFLERCARCEMVFYCSKSCQKKHWKHEGHNKACRKPGQIEVGDDMVLDKRAVPENGEYISFVQVVDRVDVNTNLWKVKKYGTSSWNSRTNEEIEVRGEKLSRLRPPPTVKEAIHVQNSWGCVVL